MASPDRWYAIAFRCDNVVEGTAYRHSEGRVVRTPPERHTIPRVGVKVSRPC